MLLRSNFETSAPHILELIEATSCPYSKQGCYLVADDDLGLTGTVNSFDAASSAMKDALLCSDFQEVDIIFLCFPIHLDNLFDLARFFRCAIEKLYSDVNEEPLDIEQVPSETWQFQLLGRRFFITVHSNLYADDHSRHLRAKDLVVLGLQPEHSFQRLGLKFLHQERVRKKFENDGRQYSPGPVTSSDLEAEKYIKPADFRAAPIRWWQSEFAP